MRSCCRMEAMKNWKKLIKILAGERQICNCGAAYSDKAGNCVNGCSANLIEAKEYIATRILEEK